MYNSKWGGPEIITGNITGNTTTNTTANASISFVPTDLFDSFVNTSVILNTFNNATDNITVLVENTVLGAPRLRQVFSFLTTHFKLS